MAMKTIDVPNGIVTDDDMQWIEGTVLIKDGVGNSKTTK